MYFWNSRALAGQLKSGDLPQRERAKYLLATLLIILVPNLMRAWFPVETSRVDLLGGVLIAALVTIVGVSACFSANRDGDGKEFVDRFVCLGWPTAIRVGVAFVVIEWVLVRLARVGSGSAYHMYVEHRSSVDLFIMTLLNAAFYWRLRYWIRLVSSTKEPPPPPCTP